MGLGLACNLDFAEGKDLNQKLKRFPKLSKLGRHGEQTSLTQTYHRRESGSRWAIFCNFFGKK